MTQFRFSCALDPHQVSYETPTFGDVVLSLTPRSMKNAHPSRHLPAQS